MTPEQAFLVAISEAPQDDTPRLVYADWLEEHNQRDRAEFIRVQIKLAAMGEVKCERTGKPLTAYGEFTDRCRCSSCKVKRREYLCSRRHIEWEWTPEPVIGVYHIFRRGFISSITLPTDAFLEHAASIIEAVPMLEEVRLTDKEPGREESEFYWLGDEDVWAENMPDRLPYKIYEHLNCKGNGPAFAFAFYADVQGSNSDLSQACLSYARERLADRTRLADTVTT